MQEHTKALYTQGIQTQIAAAEVLAEPVAQVGGFLTQVVLAGQRIFVCGEGSAHLLAQRFTDRMLVGDKFERPPFPVIGLHHNGCAGNDDKAYARQVSALGGHNDVLLVASNTQDSPQVTSAIEAALTRGMLIVALTGDDDRAIAGLLGPDDFEIRVPSVEPTRVLEQLLFVIHSLVELVEQSVFPQEVDA